MGRIKKDTLFLMINLKKGTEQKRKYIVRKEIFVYHRNIHTSNFSILIFIQHKTKQDKI